MDNMNFNELIDKAVDLLLPVLMSTGSYLFIMAKKYISRIVKSIEAKNDLDSMVKLNEMKSLLLKEIGIAVDSAVGSNMQIADKMKEMNENHKLTDEQVKELGDTAKKLIMDSLPDTLTKEDGSLMNIIGGSDKLNSIIDGMLEKYVYEYKLRSSSNNKNTSQTGKSSAQNKKYFGDK